MLVTEPTVCDRSYSVAVSDWLPHSWLHKCESHIGGGMAEWLASPDWDREAQKVLGSNPGVTRSDGQ